MKNIALFMLFSIGSIGLFSCSKSAYTHHSVRMVDAKSYLDHPMSAEVIYYYK